MMENLFCMYGGWSYNVITKISTAPTVMESDVLGVGGGVATAISIDTSATPE